MMDRSLKLLIVGALTALLLAPDAQAAPQTTAPQTPQTPQSAGATPSPTQKKTTKHKKRSRRKTGGGTTSNKKPSTRPH